MALAELRGMALFRFLGYLLSSVATMSVGSILLAFQEVPNKNEYGPSSDMPVWSDVLVLTAPDRAEGNLNTPNAQVAHVDALEALSVQSASLAPDAVIPVQSVEELNVPEVQNRSIPTQRAPLLSPPKIRSELPRLSAREDRQTGPTNRAAKQPDGSSTGAQPIARGGGSAIELRNPSGVLIRPRNTYVSLPTSEEVVRNNLSKTRSATPLAERRYSSIELPKVLRPALELPQVLRPTRP
jgi:hypothetical protein